jgi:hypothetical protein
MPPNPEVSKEFTREDLDRELADLLDNCDARLREMYSKNPLNNFKNYFPCARSPYREAVKTVHELELSTNVSQMEKIFAVIDEYLREHEIDVTTKGPDEILSEIPDTITDLYIALRNQGFTRDDLTK